MTNIKSIISYVGYIYSLVYLHGLLTDSIAIPLSQVQTQVEEAGHLSSPGMKADVDGRTIYIGTGTHMVRKMTHLNLQKTRFASLLKVV